jgi:hypothetical protein
MIPRVGLGALVALTMALWIAMAYSPAAAQETRPPLSAERVLELARGSYVGQNFSLDGGLRQGFKRTPFRLNMHSGLVRFGFEEPEEVIQLEIKSGGYVLSELIDGVSKPVAQARYSEAVRGTDLSYEDLSVRFLFWPAPLREEDERIGTSQCWKVIVKNPDKFGPYRYVMLWVDQRTGGLKQVEGYDGEQRLVRRLLVRSVQQIDAVWMLKQMRVDRYDAASGKRLGMTYLEIEDPGKKAPKPFNKG